MLSSAEVPGRLCRQKIVSSNPIWVSPELYFLFFLPSVEKKFYNLMPTSNLLILDFNHLSAFQLILIRFMFRPKVVIHVFIQLLLNALSEFGKSVEPLATMY